MKYCTRTIIGRSRFEAALVYKSRILSLKKWRISIVCKISRSKSENWVKKKYKSRLTYNGMRTVDAFKNTFNVFALQIQVLSRNPFNECM